ncbi:MAG: glycosyltransferase family 2 protein [Lachnospiraceae bacterium]
MMEDIANMPLVSVIIPVYNTKKYLVECLDSVCAQTYPKLEIIVVDDGSTDDPGVLLQEYSQKDDRIRVITQKNQGLSAARNRGLESSSGEYLMFLDSDDWIDENTCVSAIQIMADTKSDVILWSYMKEYPTSSKPVYLLGDKTCAWNESKIKTLYKQMIGLQNEQLREPQKTDSLITAWGKLYRRSIIGDIRFVDTKIIGTEDALFNIQVFSKVKRAAYTPNPFSHYRKTNSDSLTRKYKGQLVYQWQELYRRVKIQLDSENASSEYYQALSNRIALGLIGLGLNLAEDDRLNFTQKRQELKKILQMSHYQVALASLPLNYFPIHWKLFFACAKQGWSFPLSVLLLMMNRMRG